jgi:hypothetical protein
MGPSRRWCPPPPPPPGPAGAPPPPRAPGGGGGGGGGVGAIVAGAGATVPATGCCHCGSAVLVVVQVSQDYWREMVGVLAEQHEAQLAHLTGHGSFFPIGKNLHLPISGRPGIAVAERPSATKCRSESFRELLSEVVRRSFPVLHVIPSVGAVLPMWYEHCTK